MSGWIVVYAVLLALIAFLFQRISKLRYTIRKLKFDAENNDHDVKFIKDGYDAHIKQLEENYNYAITKVKEEFGVNVSSPDELVYYKNWCKGYITADELDIILSYRQLDDGQKSEFSRYLSGLAPQED